MATVTIFKNFTEHIENIELSSILQDIKVGKYRGEIEHIRFLLASGNKEEADIQKNKLFTFTPSCTFNVGKNKKLSRNTNLINQYNGMVHLDYDKLFPTELVRAINLFKKIKTTYALFISPSGNGLKVFIPVNTDIDSHDIALMQVKKHYDDKLGILADTKCKDVIRVCFMSYDPETYINSDCQTFNVDTTSAFVKSTDSKPQVYLLNTSSTNNDYQALFEESIQFTQIKESYIEGNRNNFIFLLASNCNRVGIPESEALQLINDNFDLPTSEINSTAKSAYHNHTDEFAKFAKFAETAKSTNESSGTEEETVDHLKNTPFLPDEIFDHLPDILKLGSDVFKDKRQRDVFLTSALAILSGCLPNVKGIYSQEEVYPNLYCFIIAPAASGKGALKHAKALANHYHNKVIGESREKRAIYENQLNEHKMHLRCLKKGEKADDAPPEPPFKVVFVPANTSYAKLIQHLNHNEGAGIMCETEADTMVNAVKQEWGGYSEMLRKGFHHEKVSSSKKTNNEFIEVELPRISVALSGTPSQVAGLISSSEDGLFSRFMFYVFSVEQVWQDVSPKSSSVNLTEYFNSLSFRVFSMVEYLAHFETIVELTLDQWQLLNTTFQKQLTIITTINGDDTGSIIKRLGMITFRIAMVFTALRKVENQNNTRIVTCTDKDFEIALQLISSYLEHSLLMYHNLPSQTKLNSFKIGNNNQMLLNELPQTFKRADAVKLGVKYNIPTRTVDELLKKLNGNLLSQPKTGYYEKMG